MGKITTELPVDAATVADVDQDEFLKELEEVISKLSDVDSDDSGDGDGMLDADGVDDAD